MNKKIIVILLIIAACVFINKKGDDSVEALIQAFRLGAVGQDSVVGTKCLTAKITSTGDFMTFHNAGVDYQVTAGYTFYITQLIVSGSNPNGGVRYLGYGDDGKADGNVEPTNPVIMVNEVIVSTSGDSVNYSVLIPIPASKYPYFKSAAGIDTCLAFGVEIAD